MRSSSLFTGLLLTTAATAVNINVIPQNAVADQYLVMLRSNMAGEDFEQTLGTVAGHLGDNNRVMHNYSFSDFRGFAVQASPTAIDLIRNMPEVEFVEQDSTVQQHQSATEEDQGYPGIYGLDRISHRDNYHMRSERPTYTYYNTAGSPGTVYVVDSGIYAENIEFTGRVRKGMNFAPANVNSSNPNTFTDYTGHGTHVAGIVGGDRYGVASKTNLVDVKVFNDAGETFISAIVAAINYAANDAENRGEAALSVMNLSLGTITDSAQVYQNYAVRSAVRANIVTIVSSGNDGINADRVAPANEPLACTIGNIDSNNMQRFSSNYGNSVRMLAPGVNIRSAGIEGPDATDTRTGTSMSTPFVSGIAIYLKTNDNFRFGSYNATYFCDALQDIATKNQVEFQQHAQPPGPNLIAFYGGPTNYSTIL